MRLGLWLIFVFMNIASLSAAGDEPAMVPLPKGSYEPFYSEKSGEKRQVGKNSVSAFLLDESAVTNEQYLEFVKSHSEWIRSKVKRIFAERGYLKHWQSDSKLDRKLLHQPVVNVSWFAAQAYCESKGKSLPTTDQWEYALNDQGRNSKAVKERALEWYAHPNSDEVSLSSSANGFGVRDLVGRIWEWTLDFNDFLSSFGGDKVLFCGNGAKGAADAKDYATFMRYSFRASLKASFVTNNLGFRCAKETK